MSQPLHVLLADDHRLFADGLKFILGYCPDYASIETVEDGEAVFEHLAQKKTDIVLLDVHLPKLSGIEVAARIKKEHPKVRILVVSMANDRPTVQAMIEAGAGGYCLKTAGQDELLLAMKKVSQHEFFLSAELVPVLLQQQEPTQQNPAIEKLTARELELIGWLVQGQSANQIANRLFISSHTVETHRKNIYAKLDLHNAGELMAFALKHKLVR